MKNIGKIAIVSAVLGLLILVVCTASAAFAGNPDTQGPGKIGGRITAHLDQLEEQGYDVTAIRSAIESGDMETARTLMQQFMEEHRDELPAPPAAAGPGNGGMMLGHLDHLEEQGYDVSAIRSAIESGDMETARTLMQQFMEEHKDELPAPAACDAGVKKAGRQGTRK